VRFCAFGRCGSTSPPGRLSSDRGQDRRRGGGGSTGFIITALSGARLVDGKRLISQEPRRLARGGQHARGALPYDVRMQVGTAGWRAEEDQVIWTCGAPLPIASSILASRTVSRENPLSGPTESGDERQCAQARHEAAMAQDEREQEAEHRCAHGILAFDK